MIFEIFYKFSLKFQARVPILYPPENTRKAWISYFREDRNGNIGLKRIKPIIEAAVRKKIVIRRCYSK